MNRDNNDIVGLWQQWLVLTTILFSTANKAYIFQLAPSLTTMVHWLSAPTQNNGTLIVYGYHDDNDRLPIFIISAQLTEHKHLKQLLVTP